MPLTGEAKREYQRNWIRRRRDAFFRGKSCAKCGSTQNLELDHIDPTKKVDHKIWSWAEHRRLIEIAKCQILCQDCHKEKTSTEQITDPEHGTLARYKTKRYKCRCGLCSAANALYEASRRR